ncbi:MAG: maltokinase N-terminal cap-like domain-containing protein [Actinomycetes bacterium]
MNELSPDALARLVTTLPTALRGWLPEQRWYARKDSELVSVELLVTTTLHDAEPALLDLLVTVSTVAGDPSIVEHDVYQLLVGVRTRPIPEALAGRVIAEHDHLAAYDALHDAELTRLLLHAIEAGRVVGTVHAHPTPAGAAGVVDLDLPSRVIATEQSNSSVVLGDQAILKVFRRLAAGINPEVELLQALAREHCASVPQLLGWVDGEWTEPDRPPTSATLAVLTTYLASATDGWELAKTSVRDLLSEADLHAEEVGGDFASESHRLGTTVASVHAALAAALGTGAWHRRELTAALEDMHRRLDEAVLAAPALAPFVPGLAGVFEQARGAPVPVITQRIHGDLHLGQVLRTLDGWALIDFEGEPARPLADRRAPDCALRDLAGMLRSFDYAARAPLVGRPPDPQLAYRAAEWAERNREAFLDGYAATSTVDPRAQGPLLRAFETDKAVYEVVYESRHRPDWVDIPLAAIERLVG